MNPSTDFEILTTAFAGPEAAFDRKLRSRFWELLAQTGAPVSLDALTQVLGCERGRVWETPPARGKIRTYDRKRWRKSL